MIRDKNARKKYDSLKKMFCKISNIYLNIAILTITVKQVLIGNCANRKEEIL